MSTIVITPLREQDVSTTELVQLQILVKAEDFEGLFNQIEVWRSRSTIKGPYEELTDAKWSSARIPKTAGDEPSTPITGPSAALPGTTLQLRVNERDDIVIAFTGTGVITFGEAATQLTTQGQLKVRAYVDSEGTFVVTTMDVGTGAILRVVGGDAAALLGLPIDEPYSLAYGRDARIALVHDVFEYLFTDVRGSEAYFYRTRFRNRLSSAVSEFSQPFSLGQALGLSSSQVVCGYLDLVGLDGRPLGARNVSIRNRYQYQLIEGKFVAGFAQEKSTDDTGHVEFTLVRGSVLTVAISGTDLVRTIAVPTDPSVTTFNLLDAEVSEADDVFKVQVPELVTAERRSL